LNPERQQAHPARHCTDLDIDQVRIPIKLLKVGFLNLAARQESNREPASESFPNLPSLQAKSLQHP